jgi:hypothetical protein
MSGILMGYYIDNYRFGHIIVDGKEYTSDIKILFDHIETNWRRKSGHNLELSDIEDTIAAQPEVIIIGIGSSGVMKISAEVIRTITANNIKLIIEKTQSACEIYNEVSGIRKVVAALHLTC